MPTFPPILLDDDEEHNPFQGYVDWVVGMPSLKVEPSSSLLVHPALVAIALAKTLAVSALVALVPIVLINDLGDA
ncbi:hypothetical protein SLEP1_g28111 [Rubroshorea leprosula]|uniref:Uncharacterized protein n=1 Tax=Rubroshorea leprosula TaxID=152421 RepID=A0AAV5HSQ3_9ROSI|nr:hypothetical protein SLEP1_g3796 [Rubroshorea leprosula]GKV17637.1 hypothetical protein SLEP1_g28111 [Rubroshorea leprosula]